MPYKDKNEGRAWRQAHRDRHKKLINDYLLKHPCVKCGNTDTRVLEFDHINKEDKIANVRVLMNGTTKTSRLLTEMEKCQVLCANCHRIKTIENRDFLSERNTKRQ